MSRCSLRRYCAFVAILLVLSIVPIARAADRFYVVVFACDNNPPAARGAHTFATFLKVEDAKAGEKAKPVEMVTISWLPASLDVRLLAPPERGNNFDLPSTLKIAQSQKTMVAAWGPYEIKKELFDRAVGQAKRLNSGTVAYKALDGRLRPEAATNCIHAVSDVVDGPLLDTGKAFGAPASRLVLQHLSPWIVEPQTIHRGVVGALGVDAAAIQFRDEKLVLVQKKEPK
jgi:hypothetical protein